MQKYKPLTEKLRNWYFCELSQNDSIEKQEEIKTKIKDEILLETKTMNYKFQNWLSGKSTPNAWERRIINQIAGKDIFN